MTLRIYGRSYELCPYIHSTYANIRPEFAFHTNKKASDFVNIDWLFKILAKDLPEWLEMAPSAGEGFHIFYSKEA